MGLRLILVAILLVSRHASSNENKVSEFRTFGALSPTTTTTTTTTERSVVNEKKLEEPNEIPTADKEDRIQPKAADRSFEERTFGRDGLKNIMLGGVIVAVVNIAPVILSALKNVVNLALPILGLLLFRKHRTFRYFDDFMDMFEEYTNDVVDEEIAKPQDKGKEAVPQTADEYYTPPNYPYANYDYNYYNTNPYRGYGGYQP